MDLSVEPLVNDKWAVSIPLMSYQKGAVIVQMLDDVIGPDRFQRLLRHYVRIYQFGVASTHDFLKLLRRVTKDMKTDIVEFFSVWLHQGSHPIVFIDYDKSLNRFILTQTPKMGSPEARWPIPIWTECVSGKRKPQLHWIPRNKQLVLDLDQLTGTNSSSGVAFNRKKTVYYQLSYRY
uniref:Peptidase_M1 domain-containing protein n=1 Tax=Panagrellus redivivus TaxID=6233 RepID=A0A7E4W510_PANRE